MNNPAFSEYPTQAGIAPVRKPGQRHVDGYAAAGRRHFGHWLHTSCKACFDQAWLDYQREIASRHTPTPKITIMVVAAADHLPLRYMISYISHIAAPIKPILSRKGHRAHGAETLHQAWSKAIFWPVALGGGPHGTFDCHC